MTKSVSLGDWSGSGATEALHQTIKNFSEESGRQTAKMIRLTQVIAVLTGVMSFAVFVQIWLALR